MGESLAPGEVEQAPGLARLARADDLDPDPVLALQQLAPLDEGREQQVGERAVLEEQFPQHFAIDRDVAHRLGDDGGEEDGLAGEQVHLAEEAGGAVADDLPPGGIGDRDLALVDRDEGIGRVADFEELLADLGGPLLAERGEGGELGVGENPASVAICSQPRWSVQGKRGNIWRWPARVIRSPITRSR